MQFALPFVAQQAHGSVVQIRTVLFTTGIIVLFLTSSSVTFTQSAPLRLRAEVERDAASKPQIVLNIAAVVRQG
jgi:hypothetical protein